MNVDTSNKSLIHWKQICEDADKLHKTVQKISRKIPNLMEIYLFIQQRRAVSENNFYETLQTYCGQLQENIDASIVDKIRDLGKQMKSLIYGCSAENREALLSQDVQLEFYKEMSVKKYAENEMTLLQETYVHLLTKSSEKPPRKKQRMDEPDNEVTQLTDIHHCTSDFFYLMFPSWPPGEVSTFAITRKGLHCLCLTKSKEAKSSTHTVRTSSIQTKTVQKKVARVSFPGFISEMAVNDKWIAFICNDQNQTFVQIQANSFSIDTDKPTATFEVDPREYIKEPPSSICLYEDYCVVGTDKGDLHLFSIENPREQYTLLNGNKIIVALAMTDDWIAAGSSDKFLYVTDRTNTSAMARLKGHSRTVHIVKFYEDKMISASLEGKIICWEELDNIWTAEQVFETKIGKITQICPTKNGFYVTGDDISTSRDIYYYALNPHSVKVIKLPPEVQGTIKSFNFVDTLEGKVLCVLTSSNEIYPIIEKET